MPDSAISSLPPTAAWNAALEVVDGDMSITSLLRARGLGRRADGFT